MSHVARASGKIPKIAVVGSSVTDLSFFANRLPEAGETVAGEEFDSGFGGKGANQAVAAKKCGAEVAMVSCVGTDMFGQPTIDNFKRLGIDASQVKTILGEKTGAAAIMVEKSTGQNRIVVALGANNQITPLAVDEAKPVLDKADCIIMQCEMPLETVYHTVEYAKKHGKKSILNVAPAQPVDLRKLDGLDYLIVNETEAETVSGIKVETVEDAKRSAAKLLAESGIKNVIVTLGKGGALIANREEMTHVPAFQMKAVDTTGAGDAFIGSFAAFLGEGVEEKEAVRRASLYAGLSTQNIGTQKSFPDRRAFDHEWKKKAVPEVGG